MERRPNIVFIQMIIRHIIIGIGMRKIVLKDLILKNWHLKGRNLQMRIVLRRFVGQPDLYNADRAVCTHPWTIS